MRRGDPDGAGFLDEGTAALVDEVMADALRQVDRPSADADAEVEVYRRDDEHAYVATIEGRDIRASTFAEVTAALLIASTWPCATSAAGDSPRPHRRRALDTSARGCRTSACAARS